MFDFDGDGKFDSGDAAILGGIAGFVEESLKEENIESDEELEEIRINPKDLKEPNLRLIYNSDPEFFNYIVNTIRRQNLEWRRDRLARESVADELKAIERCEQMLEGPKDKNDK